MDVFIVLEEEDRCCEGIIRGCEIWKYGIGMVYDGSVIALKGIMSVGEAI